MIVKNNPIKKIIIDNFLNCDNVIIRGKTYKGEKAF